WCAAAIVSCRSISMCRGARPRRRLCFTACCCCRRRFAAPALLSVRRSCGMDETLDRLGQTIRNALGASVTGYSIVRGELTVDAKASDIIKVVTFLRDDPAC